MRCFGKSIPSAAMHLAILAVCILLSGCEEQTAPEIHLIPAGYRGDVFIVTGAKAGVPPRREGSAIVFQIPPNGILVTQDIPSQGWHTANYYTVDASGKRGAPLLEPSTIPDTPQNRADQRQIIWFPRRGTLRLADFPCEVHFEQYYVGTPAHLLSRNYKDANAAELRLQELVQQQRPCP